MSLNLIFTVALANSGIIFCAVLPMSIVAICMEVGKKLSLPLSNGFEIILFNNVVK